MTQSIHFKCPGCQTTLQAASLEASTFVCPQCRRPGDLRPGRGIEDGIVDTCAVCGHSNLYIQKDFNRALGLAIVAAGVAVSMVLFARGEPFLAMVALVGMAAVDGVIYVLVPEVTVCYACHAIYRGFKRNPAHESFDLEMLERYGGRDPRR